MPKYPSQEDISAQDAARENVLDQLNQQRTITIEDVQKLDRLGRYQVACDMWNKCDRAAQSALRDDPHPHVRSAANLATKGR